MKTSVYVIYAESYGSSHHEGGTGPYEGHTTTSREIVVMGAQLTQPNHPYFWNKEIEHLYPLKAVYAVVVTYSDGGTFSTTNGNKALAEVVMQHSKAVKLKGQIESKKYPGYSPWSGYFASIESVDVLMLPIRPGAVEDLDVP
jgi:hypothetical protein